MRYSSMTKNNVPWKKREKERALKKEKNFNERALKHTQLGNLGYKKSYDHGPSICTVKSHLKAPGFHGRMGQKFFFSGPASSGFKLSTEYRVT